VSVELLPFRGAALFHGDISSDDRGSFQRLIDLDEMHASGLVTQIAQISAAHNARRGTIRGLHYQVPPDEETKTLWCTAGAVFDVIVDLRANEDTFGRWLAFELDGTKGVALHVPPGIAHGYQTLTNDASLTYCISRGYAPKSARSLRWDDPTLGIPWPLEVSSISEKDKQAPLWPPARC
jgi:dTDP-4-dehydrorhamnose 3,5-epimerase